MEFTDFGIAAVPAIVVLAYFAGMFFKNIEKLNKWVPWLCAVVGGVLGVVGMNIIPSFPVQDIISAAAVGVVSGLAATGAHQAGKQLSKAKKENNGVSVNDEVNDNA